VEKWRRFLRFDPLPKLVASPNEALSYCARLELLEEKLPVDPIWQSEPVTRILRKQQEDGAWRYRGGKTNIRSRQNYNQLETLRVLGQLVEKYHMTTEHPAIATAAEFLFGFQTEDGDIRGIYGNQYSPNYTAAIMELLIKAGYAGDRRMRMGFEWLLSIRQTDGGWAIPIRTVNMGLKEMLARPTAIMPDRAKPFSHCITGVVLRAFAAHPRYARTREASAAGELLLSRFFKPDVYPDRQAADFWTKFSYPFWFTDILSSLDALSLLGFPADDRRIEEAIRWLAARQQVDGTWSVPLLRTADKDLRLWVGLAICRALWGFGDE